MNKNFYIAIGIFILIAVAWGFISCNKQALSRPTADKVLSKHKSLEDSISNVVNKYPGEIGVAVIIDRTDTIAVNDSIKYPLMSMYKLHESLAVCNVLESKSLGLDMKISITRDSLYHDTWSPMLKDYTSPTFEMTVGELLEYTLIHSDNNASNLLFDRLVSVYKTDSIVRRLTGIENFNLKYTEAEMKTNYELCYFNWSSPLAYAKLIDKTFRDSLISPKNQQFIKKSMSECLTGMNRIAAPFQGRKNISFAHRTGSGFTNEKGEISAVNDGGYVTLPNRHSYSIAVFVKDFPGTKEDAEKVIANVSQVIYNYVNQMK